MSPRSDHEANRPGISFGERRVLRVARQAVSQAPCPVHSSPLRVLGRIPHSGEMLLAACCEKGEDVARLAIRRALR